MLCRECGASSTQGDSFCKSCGHDLGATALLTTLEESTEKPAIEIVREALSADFDVKNLIGRGGMGLVFRAQERSLKREVALKVLPFAHVHDEMLVARFTNEARTAAKLEHPHIVPVYRVGRSGDVIYFAMRFLNGPSLSELINEAGPLAPKDIRRILSQCAQALGYAHGHGVVHRDVKPDNIIFKDSGEVVVCDFGIARAATGSRLTGTGMALGTPYYMSPEQFRARPLDGRSDIYSLGIVGYQCLTKNLPFEGEDSFAIGYKHVTEPLAEPVLKTNEQRALFRIIDRMMAKEPEDRFPDAQAVIEELSNGSIERQTPPRRKHTTPVEPIPFVSDLPTTPVQAVRARSRPSSEAITSPGARGMTRASRTPTTPQPTIKRPGAGLRRPRRREHDRSSVAIAAAVVIALGGIGGASYYFIDTSGGPGPAAQRISSSVLTGLSHVPGLRNYVPSPDSVTQAPTSAQTPTALSAASTRTDPLSSASPDSTGTQLDSAAIGLQTLPVGSLPAIDPPNGTTAAPGDALSDAGYLIIAGMGPLSQLRIDGAAMQGVEHRLPMGAHEIIVEAPNFERYRAQIIVHRGDTVRHQVRMQRAGQCDEPDPATYNIANVCFDTPAIIEKQESLFVPLTTDVPRNPQRPVTVEIFVRPDGTVRTARLKVVSDVIEFDFAAIDYARTLRFVPARKSGTAVSAWVVVDLRPGPR